VAEITRREKEEGIIPDADIDTYMKVILVWTINDITKQPVDRENNKTFSGNFS